MHIHHFEYKRQIYDSLLPPYGYLYECIYCKKVKLFPEYLYIESEVMNYPSVAVAKEKPLATEKKK